jgi:hypothetical protein
MIKVENLVSSNQEMSGSFTELTEQEMEMTGGIVGTYIGSVTSLVPYAAAVIGGSTAGPIGAVATGTIAGALGGAIGGFLNRQDIGRSAALSG